VCGGRDYRDHATVSRVLNELNALEPIGVLIHGGAPGADTLAAYWGRCAGVSVVRFVASWDSDGRAAGPIRNARMLKEGKPDLVVAFPGGPGTLDMTRRAERAFVPVVYVSPP
jgi:hypothetical protein